MRQPKVIFFALLLAAALAGCGNDESSKTDPAGPTKSATAVQTGSGAIPDGTYAKSVTVTDAKRVGVADKDFLSANFGADGSTTFTFKFEGDGWTLFVTPGDGAPEPGDVGSLTYDEQGNAVMTSESEGCPGCTYVYDWQLVGSQLILIIVDHDSSDQPEGLAIVRFVTEGTFTRQS